MHAAAGGVIAEAQSLREGVGRDLKTHNAKVAPYTKVFQLLPEAAALAETAAAEAAAADGDPADQRAWRRRRRDLAAAAGARAQVYFPARYSHAAAQDFDDCVRQRITHAADEVPYPAAGGGWQAAPDRPARRRRVPARRC